MKRSNKTYGHMVNVELQIIGSATGNCPSHHLFYYHKKLTLDSSLAEFGFGLGVFEQTRVMTCHGRPVNVERTFQWT